MAKDQRNLLDVLKSELTFLESGGYRKPIRAKWRPQFIFQDSPTCLDYGALIRRKPCSECVLIDLVPEEYRTKKIPCRHIPLNVQGETVGSLYRTGSQEELEAAVATWLKSTILRLEGEQPENRVDSRKTEANRKAAAG